MRGNGCPPVRIGAHRLRGGTATISGAISSQFLSALLMVVRRMLNRMSALVVRDTLVSVPYVDLTLDIMARFGVEVANDGYRRFIIRGQQCYDGASYIRLKGMPPRPPISGGWQALLGQSMCVTNVPPTSAQGMCGFSTSWSACGCTVSRGERLQVTGPTQLRPLGTIDLTCLA